MPDSGDHDGRNAQIKFGGSASQPREAAIYVRERKGTDDWLKGRMKVGVAAPLSDPETSELYHTQAAITPEIEAQLSHEQPDLQRLPSPDQYRDLVAQLGYLEQIDRRREISLWRDLNVRVRDVEAAVRKAADLVDGLAYEPWLDTCFDEIGGSASLAESWDELKALIDHAASTNEAFTADERRYSIELGSIDPSAGELASSEIVDHLEKGGSLGWLAKLGKSHWNHLLNAAQVDGRQPSSVGDFNALVNGYRNKQAEARLRRRWHRQLEPLEVPPLPTNPRDWIPVARRVAQGITRAGSWRGEWGGVLVELEKLGFRSTEASSRLAEGEQRSLVRGASRLAKDNIPGAAKALEEHQRLQRLLEQERQLREYVDRYSSSNVGKIFAAIVRSRKPDEYASILAKISRLRELRVVLDRRTELLKKAAELAPDWAGAIRARTPPHDQAVPPGSLEAAWKHAQFRAELAERSKLDVDEIQRRIAELRAALERNTASVVAQQAWSSQEHRTTPSMRRALTGWVEHQKQIGKGTGKRAPKLREAAQGMLVEASKAVPVWIMPLAKAIESYDPARTRFDVVIVDEASQVGVDGLFALGLGQNVVVVGDDQQVSPLAVGENLDQLQRLIDEHLDGIPNKELFTGKLSIYDLARQSNPAIRLREHFRCVPEIISFSSHLAYDGEIQPLRDSGSVRIRPAVVEHCVRGLYEDGVNFAEVLETVALVKACSEQPEYAQATMGIIGLVGDMQWAEIETRLHSVFSDQEIVRRRLLCGNPSQFQGDERDVIFLSMTWASEGAPLRMNQDANFKKRLNVAASRARDQLWVVHSLNPDVDLKEGDLRLRLIRHARDPRALLSAAKEEKHVDSDFELTVLRRLVALNFRVTPQWKVGSYWIDLVVQGHGGRRAAIECDGDRWHSSPEHIRRDATRQQQLERLGWKFIRIRGSQFEQNPGEVIARVAKRLQEMGIEPIGPANSEEVGRDERGAELRSRVVRSAANILDSLSKGGAPSSSDSPPSERPRPAEARDGVPQAHGGQPAPPAEESTPARPKTARARSGNAKGEGSLEVVPLPNQLSGPPTNHAVARDRERPPVPEEVNKGPQAAPTQFVCRELATFDYHYARPFCATCKGPAVLMVVPNDGVVVACCSGECGTKTRVDAATLQKLADKLEAKCYNCGAPLKSIAKPHGNVLNCGTGCPNNTWERLNDRLEAKS